MTDNEVVSTVVDTLNEECERLRAKVERLTQERDYARSKLGEALAATDNDLTLIERLTKENDGLRAELMDCIGSVSVHDLHRRCTDAEADLAQAADCAAVCCDEITAWHEGFGCPCKEFAAAREALAELVAVIAPFRGDRSVATGGEIYARLDAALAAARKGTK